MSELRYKILNESISAHCCFEYTVVDTSIIDEYGDFQTMCETFEKDEAEIICTALNFLQATQEKLEKIIDPENEA